MKENTHHTLLASMPTSLIWKLKVILLAPIWILSTSDNKKTWKQFYCGLIKHKHEYDYDKLTRERYLTFASCKHHGCSLITTRDKQGNSLRTN